MGFSKVRIISGRQQWLILWSARVGGLTEYQSRLHIVVGQWCLTESSEDGIMEVTCDWQDPATTAVILKDASLWVRKLSSIMMDGEFLQSGGGKLSRYLGWLVSMSIFKDSFGKLGEQRLR